VGKYLLKVFGHDEKACRRSPLNIFLSATGNKPTQLLLFVTALMFAVPLLGWMLVLSYKGRVNALLQRISRTPWLLETLVIITFLFFA
jgi:hypothetical protein